MRDADIVSIDMKSIRAAELSSRQKFSPNGFDGKEICAISRYAGISNKVSSFGVFEFNDICDRDLQTVHLMSQIIWYFLEGFYLRVNDSPNAKNIHTNYQKYIVPIKDSDLQFIFYKSKNTGRWWFSSSMDFNEDINYKKKIIACSYEDYLNTISGDIPKRIYRILKTTA